MNIAAYVMGAIYVLAGTLHLVRPGIYRRMMPPYLPAHDLLILLSGLAEIACGLLVAYPPTRALGAWGLIALLIAVFPANVKMLQSHAEDFARIPAWVLWARLPLQGVLMYWAYLYTGD